MEAAVPTVYIYRCRDCAEYKVTPPKGFLGFRIKKQSLTDPHTKQTLAYLILTASSGQDHFLPFGYSRYQGREIDILTDEEGEKFVEKKHACLKTMQAATVVVPLNTSSPTQIKTPALQPAPKLAAELNADTEQKASKERAKAVHLSIVTAESSDISALQNNSAPADQTIDDPSKHN